MSEKEPSVLKYCTIIVAADLLSVIPNEAKGLDDCLFAQLQESDPNVRHLTFCVIAHLILRHILNPDNRLHILAKCLLDQYELIQNRCSVFFSEYLQTEKNASSILYKIFCSLSTEVTPIMQILINKFASPNQQGELSELIVKSILERPTEEKAQVLSILPLSSKLGATLETALSNMNSNISQFCSANQAACNYVLAYLHKKSKETPGPQIQ